MSIPHNSDFHHGLLTLAIALVWAPLIMAQGTQTGTVRGWVRDSQGLVLPGATVTVASDAMQGSRSTRVGAYGSYEIQGLPPGDYSITFELTGFTDVVGIALVPLGGTAEVSVSMEPAEVVEVIQVVSVVPSALASIGTSSNIRAPEIDALPVERNIFTVTELAPGLTNNTPNNNQVVINGAFAYDNVFLIDGVDVNDNLFGTVHNLFIEDAIEEMQVLTSGISAEYGRFSGGVINTITKSGANTFSGSFRANLYKPDWTVRTPFETASGQERTGSLANNASYETTAGGPIVQDRLWFFYANRVQRESESETFAETGMGYDRELRNDRNLIKFTGTITAGHGLEGSYMRNSTERLEPTFPFSIDPNTFINPSLPNDLWVVTYRAAITSQLFAEFQVSRKRLAIEGVGGTLTDIRESPFLGLTQTTANGLPHHYNGPYFDAQDPEERNNRQITGNATYYLSTRGLGTHSLKGGFEHFQSTNAGGNSQTATGYVFDADYAVGTDGAPQLDADGRLIPVFQPFANLIENWRPVRGATLDINTLSFYVNDNWQLGNHLTFNLGVRAEKVDSEATGNIVGIDTSAIVPRLAVAYDPFGSGQHTFQATYGHYAGKYNEAQFSDNTNVGNPDLLLGVYTGPPGQGRDFAPGFDPNNYMTVFGLFPTRNVFFADDISSPLTKEFTLSGGTTLGNRGYTKVTYIHRTMSNFVEDFFTLDSGVTTIIEDGQNFGTFVNQQFRNTDALDRSFDGLMFQGRYRVTSRLLFDGSWTIQLGNEGNFAGEASNRPAISSSAFDWPEITPANRYLPSGRLDSFQRHKARVWGIYSLGLGNAGGLDIGGLWRYNSGRVYSLRATNQQPSAVQQAII